MLQFVSPLATWITIPQLLDWWTFRISSEFRMSIARMLVLSCTSCPKKHVHSSFMRHQLHVFQKWFILYIYVVILGCCSLFIFINKKECHYISHISQAFGRKIHPSCLQVMKGFCPHLLLKPKSALGWLDDSTLTAVRSPLRHQLMPRDFHLLKS